jgi:TonB family protein
MEEKLPDARVRWSWQGQQATPRDEEPNQPSTFLDCVWVQVSDLNGWQPLSNRLAEVWHQAAPGPDLLQFPGFARPAEVNDAAVHQLIRHIQDEFRYLSVDLESGGWIPAPPAVVAQRRFGDCKDLVWLASSVLRAWGVTTRPILVATGLRGRVQDLRPMALLFNHAVLEVEIGGHTRWFDMTSRHQGGNFASQSMPWYGAGLPVDFGASLRPQPGTRARGIYAVRETIELDTRRGEPSIVEICVCAEGWNADQLRSTRVAQGADEFARERLVHTRRRYGKAERIGALEWRDDRDRNVCELAEAFEVREVIYPGEGNQRALFDVPANLLIQMLSVPEQKKRRGPWDLPHSFEARHEVRIKARSMGAAPRNRQRWVCSEFAGTLEDSREAGVWKKTIRLSVNSDEVGPDRIDEYRRVLDQFLLATTWRLYLPWNESRVPSATALSKLPAAAEGMAAYVPAADLDDFKDATSQSGKTMTPPVFSPMASNGNNGWWYAVPFALLVFFGASRSCDTTMAPRSIFTPTKNDLFLPQTNPEDAVKFFESMKVDGDDEPLPPGPEIKGDVYSGATTVDRTPQAMSRIQPKYPRALRLDGVEGEALIEFVVTDEGIPAHITVVKQTHAAFGKAASVAVSKWRFRPAMKQGHPVNMTMQVPFTFKLTD